MAPTQLSNAKDPDSANMIRTRCRGKKTKNQVCTKFVTHARDQQAFCLSHATQRPRGVPKVKRCEGIIREGRYCTAQVKDALPGLPTFCRVHKDQIRLIKYTECFGTDHEGQRCKQKIRWQEPFQTFCELHHSQVKKSSCPITKLPNDVASMIFDRLEPYDKVAFALANRSCVALMRSYGKANAISWIKNHPQPRLLAAKSYEHYAMSRSNTDDSDGIVPESCKRYTLDRDFSCDCFPAPLVYDDSLPIYRQPFQKQLHTVHNYPRKGSPLLRAMRQHPSLFRESPGLCVVCKRQIGRASCLKWAKRADFHVDAVEQRQRLAPILMDRNPEVFLCSSCVSGGPSNGAMICCQWCTGCFGELTPTVIARAYWAGQQKQKVGERKDVAAEQTAENEEHTDYTEEQMVDAGEQMEDVGEQMEDAGEQMEDSGEQLDDAVR